VTVLSTTVADNNATGILSGTITAAATAQINIHSSSFYRNAAANGGAVHAKEKAVVTIQGSRFEGNNATVRGGAIFATDQAWVQMLPSRSGLGEHLHGIAS
jgi:predicted outer membrane repeat protein